MSSQTQSILDSYSCQLPDTIRIVLVTQFKQFLNLPSIDKSNYNYTLFKAMHHQHPETTMVGKPKKLKLINLSIKWIPKPMYINPENLSQSSHLLLALSSPQLVIYPTCHHVQVNRHSLGHSGWSYYGFGPSRPSSENQIRHQL